MRLPIEKTDYIYDFTLLYRDKKEALPLQLMQCTYQLHSGNEYPLQGRISFHLLQSSSSGQTSQLQGEYVVY